METITKCLGSVALVAEDEAVLRMEAADLLADAGFAVLEAPTAVAALAHLERTPAIKLLFTDIEMPGPIDGLDLANEVGRRWPGILIIVCSGRVQPKADALPEGARFIGKPYTAALVAGIMQEIGLR